MTRDLLARYGGQALVTGASSGIGAVFAEELARRGFPLLLTARREDRLEALAERLRAEHRVGVEVLALDLAEPRASKRLIDAVAQREIGLLVSNAGFGASGLFDEHDPARSARMIRLHCGVTTALCHAFVPRMLARGRGGIVVVASIAGLQPTPYFALYGATKAFQVSLAEALWQELRGTGVDVVALCPGTTRTEFAQLAHTREVGHGMEPLPVVRAALARLGRGPSVVTGLQNRFSVALPRFLPRSWVARATGEVLARRLLGKPSWAVRRRR